MQLLSMLIIPPEPPAAGDQLHRLTPEACGGACHTEKATGLEGATKEGTSKINPGCRATKRNPNGHSVQMAPLIWPARDSSCIDPIMSTLAPNTKHWHHNACDRPRWTA